MTMTDQQTTTTSNTQSAPVLCKHGCGFFVSNVYGNNNEAKRWKEERKDKKDART